MRSQISAPLGFSPTAAHKLAHSDGELATSRAAAKKGIPMCLSTYATTRMEDVIAQGAGNPYAKQVSFLKDRRVTERIIKRAERAGFKALFVNVDLPVLGKRVNELRNKFSPTDLEIPTLLEAGESDTIVSHGTGYDPSVTWEEAIAYLRKTTSLPIYLKGVVSAEDVQLAIDYGVDGVVISNHGGRQLDGQASTLDVLREVGPVARGKISVIIDGGIRRGSDIFKAISLGATACFVGRIAVWGLAYNGQEGVERAIDILLDEFANTMALMGCRTVADITPAHVSVLENGVLSKL